VPDLALRAGNPQVGSPHGRTLRAGDVLRGRYLAFFVVLLVPAVVVGYAIGNSEKQETRTVTVSENEAIRIAREQIKRRRPSRQMT
jgi:hypothetical protein